MPNSNSQSPKNYSQRPLSEKKKYFHKLKINPNSVKSNQKGPKIQHKKLPGIQNRSPDA